MFSIEIDIGDQQLQSAYRHVHHADALRFLERARLAYLEHLGTPNGAFIERGLLTVVSRLNVQYKREIRGGPARVTCENGRFVGKTLILEQKIYNERGKLAIEAILELMFMSAATRRAVAPPDEFRQRVEADVGDSSTSSGSLGRVL
jgi:thioesterase III